MTNIYSMIFTGLSRVSLSHLVTSVVKIMGNEQQSTMDYSGFAFPGVFDTNAVDNQEKKNEEKQYEKNTPNTKLELSESYNVNLIDKEDYYLIPSKLDPNKDKNVIKIVCISDTHGDHRELSDTFKLPSADILIHCGDFSNNGRLQSIKDYDEWIGDLIHKQNKYKYAILIAGNHDVTLDPDFYKKTASNWGKKQDLKQCNKYTKNGNNIYLENESVTLFGITFYGSPYQPKFCDWAFQKERGEELKQEWNKIPDNGSIDILLTHGPPKYHGDLVDDYNNVGCEDLLQRVYQIPNIKYHIFGHVHEGYGVTRNKDMKDTVFINAATVNMDYEVANKPIMLYIQGKKDVNSTKK